MKRSTKAADNVRAREREANRNVVEAVAERRLEDKYARTLETLRGERDAHAHAGESLRQQVREAQDIELKMQESRLRFEKVVYAS